MGIQGLLRFLKDATTEIHIRQYAGRCVAVDTYCWLHRGAFACADKLAKGEKTDQYVRYCMKFVDMLESYNVRPILVFDGCRLPSKKEVEKQRRERREMYMQKGKQFLREGRLNDARDAFTKCVSVTPQMALNVIEVARERGIDCIVAPYEADAQLAFLLKQGYAQAVVTEDSDLLCFGCQKVILKMDLTGRAQEISLDKFDMVKNLAGFTVDSFRHMCILSGCDYLPSIKGIGLVKACKALKLAKNKDVYQTVRRLNQYIKGLGPVEPVYAAGFERADRTFLYQLVFDPKTRTILPLNHYPIGVTQEELLFAGPLMSNEQALQIALGNTDVNTGKRFGQFDVDEWLKSKHFNGKSVMRNTSIWQSDFFDVTSKKNSAVGKESGKGKKVTMRGKEIVVDMSDYSHFSKMKKPKKKELISQDEASESCSKLNVEVFERDGNGRTKMTQRAPDAGEVMKDMSSLLSTYRKLSGQTPSRGTLRQRMRSERDSVTQDQDCIVRSRFFTELDTCASFVEENEEHEISHVDETPETSNSSTVVNQPSSMMEEKDLSNILQDLTSDSKASPIKKVEARNTPLKRKNPFACSSNDAKLPKSSPHTPACLKRFKRMVVIPQKIEISDASSEIGRNEELIEDRRRTSSSGEEVTNIHEDEIKMSEKEVIAEKVKTTERGGGVGYHCDNLLPHEQDDESQRCGGPNLTQTIGVAETHFSTEDIPYLDHLQVISGKMTEKDCDKSVKTNAIKHNLNTHKISTLKENLCPEDMTYKDFISQVASEPKPIEHKTKSEKLNFFSMGMSENPDPIVLSSDEEKIPYIDDLSVKPCKRQKVIGLHRKTSPLLSSSSVKSKYFGEAKASGLRKTNSSSVLSKKKKAAKENPKSQPKITSLFTKSAKIKGVKALSPSNCENLIDFTPETDDDVDGRKTTVKALPTRKLFPATIK